MPSYLSPGVYVEEVASGSRPIEEWARRWRPSSVSPRPAR